VILRSEIRAADYRARARAASAAARACLLQQVRERHRAAAATWQALAKSEDRRVAGLRRRFTPATQSATARPVSR